MATINQNLPTLLDQVKRTAPDGSIDDVVEALTQFNPMLEDAVFFEGNLSYGHRYTSRTALPSVGWRKLNEGVTPGKSVTDQVDEGCGMMEAWSAIDVKVAEMNGNAAAFRASEDSAFLQAFANEAQASFMYYSTTTAPEKINGLAPRLNSTSATGGTQIVLSDGSASGSDQTSVWLIGWGPQGVFGIYPKGSRAGLQRKDLGTQLWDDGTGANKKFEAYVTKFTWDVGLVVRDFRKIARVANIDTSAITASGTNVIEAMIKAWHKVDHVGNVRYAWYCNRTIGTYLHLQARAGVTNSTLTIEEIGGRPVTKFLGIPVRECDVITNAEDIIS